MTQIQRDQVLAELRKRGIAASYGTGEFILYKNSGRCLSLKESNPLLVFFGPQYEIMRSWAEKAIYTFAKKSFQDWKCCRRNTQDPVGDRAVWFQLKAEKFNGDWSGQLESVINVTVALYNKLNEDGILSDSFDANNYINVDNIDHQGVVTMNEKTKDGFSKWMAEQGVQETQRAQHIGYMENHIAKGRCLNVLDDQGNPVKTLDDLVKELSANKDNWNTFSQNIQGTDNSKNQYKVALGKFIEFAKSVRDGVPPQNPTNQEGRQKELKEMKPRNLIIFGAPGTGKSHKLQDEVNTNFVDNDGERYERVTFYPTYSYAQFVGTYKPVMEPKANGTAGEEIAYKFVPGPFLRVLVNALNEPDKNRCLVIEEINRANAAAVFGDVFQLLDRGENGESEYAIAASEDVKKHLDKALTESGKNALRELTGSIDSLKIPANMYIWATMNSADQGVFPMDTAFKRRWEFEYINIDNGKEDCAAWTIEGKTYNWNKLREFINDLLSLHGVNEDKLMGAHFVKAMGNSVPDKAFKSKVLMYLWEDAARMIRRQMFGNILTYSQLCAAWQQNGVKVFENDSELNKAKDGSPLKKSYEELKEPATSSGATDQHPADTDTGHQENPE